MDFYSEAELSGIWQATVESMRRRWEGSRQSFSLWFGLVKLASLDANSAAIACENKMKQSVLTERYLTFIRESLEEVIGYSPTVTVTVDPSLAPPLADADEESPIRTEIVEVGESGDDDLPPAHVVIRKPAPHPSNPTPPVRLRRSRKQKTPPLHRTGRIRIPKTPATSASASTTTIRLRTSSSAGPTTSPTRRLSGSRTTWA